MAVVVYHANVAASIYMPETYSAVTSHMFQLGAAGVHVFFVISGFIMVHTASGRSGTIEAALFWYRRATRIFPIYWVLALTYLVAHSIFGTSYQLSLTSILLALLLVPGWQSAIIGPAWTLTYEIYFYLCFGASLFLPSRYALVVLSAAFVALVGTGMIWPFPIPLISDPLLIEFLAGAWVARLLPLVTWRPQVLATILIVAGILAIGLTTLVGYEAFPRLVIWGLPSVMIVAGAALLGNNAGIDRIMAKLSVLGDSSYVLYLVHILVLDVVMTIIVNYTIISDVAWVPVLLGVAASILAAIAIHKFIELPLLRLLRRRPVTAKA